MKKVSKLKKAKQIVRIISAIEKKIAEEPKSPNDADSIKDKILNLKRKLGMFKEILRKYPSSPYNLNNEC
jgi:uncharacterized coiled-coil DUF342 family protein